MNRAIVSMLRHAVLPVLLVGMVCSSASAQQGLPPREGEGRQTPPPPREGGPRDGEGRGPRDGEGRGPRDGEGRGPGDGEGRGLRDGEGRGPGGPGGGEGRGPGGPGGPGTGDRPGAGGAPARGPDFEQMRGYLELVDRYAKMSENSSTAGVAAVVASGDALRRQGPTAAISYFEKVLPEVKDPTVARAIRIQLADLYRRNGNDDKALAQLRSLMTEAPVRDTERETE